MSCACFLESVFFFETRVFDRCAGILFDRERMLFVSNEISTSDDASVFEILIFAFSSLAICNNKVNTNASPLI